LQSFFGSGTVPGWCITSGHAVGTAMSPQVRQPLRSPGRVFSKPPSGLLLVAAFSRHHETPAGLLRLRAFPHFVLIPRAQASLFGMLGARRGRPVASEPTGRTPSFALRLRLPTADRCSSGEVSLPAQAVRRLESRNLFFLR